MRRSPLLSPQKKPSRRSPLLSPQKKPRWHIPSTRSRWLTCSLARHGRKVPCFGGVSQVPTRGTCKNRSKRGHIVKWERYQAPRGSRVHVRFNLESQTEIKHYSDCDVTWSARPISLVEGRDKRMWESNDGKAQIQHSLARSR